MAPPSIRTPEIEEEILGRLIEGQSLVMICKIAGMPHYKTVWRWEQDDAEFRARMDAARVDGTHYMAGDCLRISDSEDIKTEDKRVMIDTRLRLIGKWNRRIYGEKQLVGSDPDNPLPTGFIVNLVKPVDGDG